MVTDSNMVRFPRKRKGVRAFSVGMRKFSELICELQLCQPCWVTYMWWSGLNNQRASRLYWFLFNEGGMNFIKKFATNVPDHCPILSEIDRFENKDANVKREFSDGVLDEKPFLLFEKLDQMKIEDSVDNKMQWKWTKMLYFVSF